MGRSASQVVRSNGEQPAAAQIREDQAGATIVAAHQSEVQHIPARAVHGHGLGKDDAISSAGSHVVHQDGSCGCVRHVDEDAAVQIVIGDDVLESRRGTRQAGQIDAFHQLEEKYPVMFYQALYRTVERSRRGNRNLKSNKYIDCAFI